MGVDTTYSLTGTQVEEMDDETLKDHLSQTKVFFKLTPLAKDLHYYSASGVE